jgi:hypothetical protein
LNTRFNKREKTKIRIYVKYIDLVEIFSIFLTFWGHARMLPTAGESQNVIMRHYWLRK